MAGSKYSATQQGILFCSFIIFIVPALGQSKYTTSHLDN